MTEPLADIAERLELCFAEIERTRMDGVPILNRALSVKAVGLRAHGEAALCVLVTPWFMNLMLQPVGEEAPARIGEKRMFAFPAGSFEFIRGEEGAIGAYWMCSLFSPVFEFADQETAEAAAAAALEQLMRGAEAPTESEAEMALIWRGETPAPETEAEAEPAEAASVRPSRRDLLHGRLREGEPS